MWHFCHVVPWWQSKVRQKNVVVKGCKCLLYPFICSSFLCLPFGVLSLHDKARTPRLSSLQNRKRLWSDKNKCIRNINYRLSTIFYTRFYTHKTNVNLRQDNKHTFKRKHTNWLPKIKQKMHRTHETPQP